MNTFRLTMRESGELIGYYDAAGPDEAVCEAATRIGDRRGSVEGVLIEERPLRGAEGLRRIRVQMQLTQTDMAQALGVDRTQLAKYETGDSRVPTAVPRAARALLWIYVTSGDAGLEDYLRSCGVTLTWYGRATNG